MNRCPARKKDTAKNLPRWMHEACDESHSKRDEGVYLKCLIDTILRFDRLDATRTSSPHKRKGIVFLTPWEDLTFSKVHVMGVVTSCSTIGSSGFQISIDDGSGRICGVWWSKERGSTMNPEIFYNRFVSVRGHLTGFRSELQIRIDEISIVTTDEEPTEESLWWLDVKEEWESLAARKVSGACPCLCHTFSGVPCKAMGTSTAWPDSFVRAVLVISSTLRLAAGSEFRSHVKTTLSEIVSLTKMHAKESSSLSLVPCFSDCAVVEAVRDLLKKQFIRKEKELLYIYSAPQISQTPQSFDVSDEPRFPPTPVVVPSQGVPKERSKPKFFGSLTE